MIRIGIEALLVVAAYVAGVLSHKWAVKNANKALNKAQEVVKS